MDGFANCVRDGRDVRRDELHQLWRARNSKRREPNVSAPRFRDLFTHRREEQEARYGESPE